MKNYTIQEKIYIVIAVVSVFGILILAGYQSGKRSEQRKETKAEIKTSEKQESLLKDSLKILKQEVSLFKEKGEKLKYVYIKGKETVKYITKERVEQYSDTACKKDVVTLKNHLSNADSLISIQENQLTNFVKQLELTDKIILEKDQQIFLYKNQKHRNKKFSIAIIAGPGTDFKNGFTFFTGVGISRNLISF